MKRTLQFLGGVLVLGLLLVIAGMAYLFYLGPRLDASSKAYVDQSMPIILNNWSQDALWDRAAPEFKTTVHREQLRDLFEKCSVTLGNLQKYEGSTGEANLSFLLNKGKIVTARYTVRTDFAKGPAIVIVGLIQREGQWQVLSLQVNSPLLLK